LLHIRCTIHPLYDSSVVRSIRCRFHPFYDPSVVRTIRCTEICSLTPRPSLKKRHIEK
jgi:hypothetical protein